MTYKRISDMTPTEFERCCLDILSGYAEEEHLNGFEITHNKIIKASDGRYQIDVYAEFTAMGARFKILCECKKYKYRVGREKVAVLHRKLDSIGAQKGILISTSLDAFLRLRSFPVPIHFHAHSLILIAVSYSNTPNTGYPVLGVHNYSIGCSRFC